MKDNITRKRVLINKIFTFFGILLFLLCLSLATYDFVLEQRAVNINATIISLDYNGNKKIATVRYKAENQTYEQKVTLPNYSNLSVKDETKIKYDMNNPEHLINNNHEIIIGVSLLVSLFILIFNLPKFISNFKNQHRINKLYKNGIYIKANITDIIVDNNGKKVKKILPYKLRCKYLNPTNNKEYVFESEDTYTNPSAIIKQYNSTTIVVLIDKTNPQNYYVDLDSLTPQINIVDPKTFMSQNSEKTNESSK